MCNLAPVALFVYNRLWHTKKTIDALLANDLSAKSDLFIFSDAAKDKESYDSVKQVRQYLTTITGFNTVTITKRDYNFGLANSIIDGVTRIVDRYGKIIVLEDDLVTSTYFLRYMNDALAMYANDLNIASIHGYIYNIPNLPQTFFIRGADCWGWATWKRAWNFFEKDGQLLLDQLKKQKLLKKFDFDATAGFKKMLQNQIAGKNNSWAVRWHASAFIQNMLTLYPGVSFVNNIGNDNTGTHCDKTDIYSVALVKEYSKINKISTREHQQAWKKMKNFYNSLRPSLLQSLRFRIKKLLQ